MSRSPRRLPRWVGHLPYGLARCAAPRDVVGLVYHALASRPVPWIDPLYPCKSPEAFAADLAYLASELRPVDDAALAAARFEGKALPPRAVAIGFDDGFAACHADARPLLLRRGVPCTFFVVTGVLDNTAWMWRSQAALCLARLSELSGEPLAAALARLGASAGRALASAREAKRWLLDLDFAERGRLAEACDALGVRAGELLAQERPYLTRAQVAELHRDGFTIGAHTAHHPRLHRLGGPEAIEREILDSVVAVREITGQRRVPVAFPFNGLALDRAWLGALRRRYPELSLFYDTNRLRRDEPFVVNRIPADAPEGAPEGGSNLALLLRQEHLLEPLRALRRRAGRLAGRAGVRNGPGESP